MTLYRLAVSALAYVVWIVVLPKYGGYSVRQVTQILSDGAQTLQVVKIPNSEVAEWDATHDEHGELIGIPQKSAEKLDPLKEDKD